MNAQRPLPELGDEAGFRCATEIVEWVIKTRGVPDARSNTLEEAWNLGIEEVLYRLKMDLDWLNNKQQIASQGRAAESSS